MSDDLIPRGDSSSLAPPEDKRHRRPRLILAAIVAVLALLGAGLFMVLQRPASKTVAAPAPTATAAPAPAPTVAPTPTVSPAPKPAPTVKPTPKATTAPAPTATPTPPSKGGMLAPWTDCGNGVLANSATSCQFARAVAYAYQSAGGGDITVYAYSDATRTTYAMACRWEPTPIVCTGGNGAVVEIQHN